MLFDQLQRFSIANQQASNYNRIDDMVLETYINPQSDRYLHILGVVRLMRKLSDLLDLSVEQKEWLVQSAYLHDIGYSETLSLFEFHPVDGALFAWEQGFPRPVLAAVLFHSEAMRTRDLSPTLVSLYEKNHSLLDERDLFFIQLITYCDLHSSPQGEEVTLEERVTEIVDRYGAEHAVSQQMLHNMKYYLTIENQVNNYISSVN